MRPLRLIGRVFGWLLTPFVAWAASFLGAATMSKLVAGVSQVRVALALSIIGGGLAAALALLLWLRLLRRSPRLREALQVTQDATPVASDDDPAGASS